MTLEAFQHKRYGLKIELSKKTQVILGEKGVIALSHPAAFLKK